MFHVERTNYCNTPTEQVVLEIFCILQFKRHIARGTMTQGASEVLDLHRGVICESLLTELLREDTSMGTVKRNTCSYETTEFYLY